MPWVMLESQWIKWWLTIWNSNTVTTELTPRLLAVILSYNAMVTIKIINV